MDESTSVIKEKAVKTQPVIDKKEKSVDIFCRTVLNQLEMRMLLTIYIYMGQLNSTACQCKARSSVRLS